MTVAVVKSRERYFATRCAAAATVTGMAYAVLEESVRLLEGLDAPASVLHLSRRIRHLPVAVDREDDVAATMFLRRGVSGEPWIDVHSLVRSEGRWRPLGGGSGNAEE